MTATRELRALLALARAHVRARAVRVRFRDTERATALRTIDVLALAYDPPRWVAAAWVRETEALRLLDLARILRVFPTRRRARAGPAGFDPVWYASRRFLDPDAGPVVAVAVRLDAPWSRVALALFPSGEVAAASGNHVCVNVRASRPAIVGALQESLRRRRGVD
jgi:predicted DNA-binding transcriptional regulator YafY